MLFTYPLWELSIRERSTEAFQLSEPRAPIQPHCLSLPGPSYITHAQTWSWPCSYIWRLILTTATLLQTPGYQLVLRLPHKIYAVFLKHLVPFSLLSSNTPPPLHPSLSSQRLDLPDKNDKIQDAQFYLNFRKTKKNFSMHMPCVIFGTYLQTQKKIHCLSEIQI